MYARFLLCLAILGLVSGTASAKPPPRVVTSIAPLHSLVAQVMAGIAEPSLIMKRAASPHKLALKPSDASALENADLVFWMGVELEPSLARALSSATGPVGAIDLSKAAGLIEYPVRDDAIWRRNDPKKSAPGQNHETVDELDPHFWLSPVNAAIMVDTIAQSLARHDPERAARYTGNAARVRSSLAALDTDLATLLAPVRHRPFIVFHDAYQYFDRHYGLAAAGAILLHDGDRPGVKRIRDLRTAIADRGIVCVFAERQTRSRLVSTVTEGTDARIGELDPLGADRTPGPDAYAALLRGLAQDLVDCLAK